VNDGIRTIGRLPFHEIAALFPLMEGEPFEQLKADIQAHGQREPIWTWQGKIIDGRNRYRACNELGILPLMRVWDGNGSLVQFVVSLNLHRRHLDKGQLAAVAVEMLPLLEAEAKERQRASGGKKSGLQAVPQKVGEPPNGAKRNGEAAVQAAKIVGTNAQYVRDARKLKAESPENFEQVKAGKLKLGEAKRQTAAAEACQEEHQDQAAGRKLRGVGVVHAHEAINSLQRIPPQDALRERAFQIVMDWIKNARKKK
jgi:hypothetical protein